MDVENNGTNDKHEQNHSTLDLTEKYHEEKDSMHGIMPPLSDSATYKHEGDVVFVSDIQEEPQTRFYLPEIGIEDIHKPHCSVITPPSYKDEECAYPGLQRNKQHTYIALILLAATVLGVVILGITKPAQNNKSTSLSALSSSQPATTPVNSSLDVPEQTNIFNYYSTHFPTSRQPTLSPPSNSSTRMPVATLATLPASLSPTSRTVLPPVTAMPIATNTSLPLSASVVPQLGPTVLPPVTAMPISVVASTPSPSVTKMPTPPPLTPIPTTGAPTTGSPNTQNPSTSSPSPGPTQPPTMPPTTARPNSPFPITQLPTLPPTLPPTTLPPTLPPPTEPPPITATPTSLQQSYQQRHSTEEGILDLLDWERQSLEGLLTLTSGRQASPSTTCSPPLGVSTACCIGSFSTGGDMSAIDQQACKFAMMQGQAMDALRLDTELFFQQNPVNTNDGGVIMECDVCQILELARAQSLTIAFLGDSTQNQIAEGFACELERRNYVVSRSTMDVNQDYDGTWANRRHLSTRIMQIRSPLWENDQTVSVYFHQMYLLPAIDPAHITRITGETDILILVGAIKVSGTSEIVYFLVLTSCHYFAQGFGLHWWYSNDTFEYRRADAYGEAMLDLFREVAAQGHVQLLAHRETTAEHYDSPGGDYWLWYV
jgi:hypothetical protein